MHTFDHHHDSIPGHLGHDLTGRICRTHRQIATILARRHGEAISPENVKQICRTAEAKLLRALLTDAFTPLRRRAGAGRDRTTHAGGAGEGRSSDTRSEP